MTDKQRQEVEELFGDLMLSETAERSARLATVTDEAVRAEVASLLGFAGGEGRTFSGAIGTVMEAASSDGAFDEGKGHNQRFGPYRVTGKAGQGGMGSVYSAVRDDGTYDKQVAIKVMHFGLDVSRFRRERNILASLEHPNIARLLDGGETDTGVSYIVLEFVDGMTLPAYCEEHNLTIPKRLNLFLQVCAAVQYAHQNLIVHRDLKPSNILVTSEGIPKLLDFGIAKLIDHEMDRTGTAMHAFTPRYASPEQVRGGAISAASDVYSLGVVLYELLTGRRPYEFATTAALDIDRTICETQPAAPGLSGDLDNILLMALRKEPHRRYGTVGHFAQDIQRAMEDRPVHARADTFQYRAGKFLRRNRVWLAAAAAAGICLTAALGLALYQAHLADQRFQQVRKLANTFLFQFHDKIVDIPGTTDARAFVLKTALEYLDNLSKSAGNDPELRSELAEAYQRVGDVQGAPRRANLGDYQAAVTSYERALSLYGPLASKNVKYARSEVDCLRSLAFLRLEQHKFPEARDYLKRASAVMAPFENDGTTETLSRLAGLHQTLADIEEQHGSLDEAVAQNRDALRYWEAWSKAVPPSEAQKVPAQLSSAHLRVGRSLMERSDLNPALPELQAALSQSDESLKLDTHNTRNRTNHVLILMNLAVLYGDQGLASLEQYDNAVRCEREAVEWILPFVQADKLDMTSKVRYIGALFGLANGLARLHPGDGRTEARRAVGLWREAKATGKLLVSDRRTMAVGLRAMVPLFGEMDHNAGFRLANELLAEQRELLAQTPRDDDDHWLEVEVLWTVADEARALGNVAEAKRMLDQALEVSRPFIGASGQQMQSAFLAARLYQALTRDRIAAHDCKAAMAWQKQEIDVWEALAKKNDYARMRMQRASQNVLECH